MINLKAPYHNRCSTIKILLCSRATRQNVLSHCFDWDVKHQTNPNNQNIYLENILYCTRTVSSFLLCHLVFMNFHWGTAIIFLLMKMNSIPSDRKIYLRPQTRVQCVTTLNWETEKELAKFVIITTMDKKIKNIVIFNLRKGLSFLCSLLEKGERLFIWTKLNSSYTYPRSLDKIGPLVLEKKINRLKIDYVFILCRYSLPIKRHGPLFENLWILFTYSYFVPSLVEIAQWFWIRRWKGEVDDR